MAVQTKHYVELADIRGLRLTCDKCKGSLVVDMKDGITTKVLESCPQCNAAFTFHDGNAPVSIGPAISAFVISLRALKDALKNRPDSGCCLGLEIEAGPAVQSLGETTKRWL